MRIGMRPTFRLIFLSALGAFLWLSGWLYLPIGYVVILGTATVVDIAVTRWLLQHLRVERKGPQVLELGTAQTVQILISNPTFLPASVLIKDDVPDALDWETQGKSQDHLRPILKTRIGPYFRKVVSYSVIPKRRGDFTWTIIVVALTSSLGLVQAFTTMRQDQTFSVLPNLAEARKFELVMKKMQMSQFGSRPYPLRGAGTEFASLRDYCPDDDPRWIDWNATARRGRLVSKEFQWERGQNVIALVDSGRVMATRLNGATKLDHAVNACAFLLYLARHLDDKIGLMVFSQTIDRWLSPRRGLPQWEACLRVLRQVEPRFVEADYQRAFTFIGNQVTRRSFFIVFSDLTDPDTSEALLSYCGLLAEKHYVLLVAVSDFEYQDVLKKVPQTEEDLFRCAAAIALMQERMRAVAFLKERGVAVLDATPEKIWGALVDHYFLAKRRL
ncbi:MAG: DUF58 domain-containing protein [Armatimonadetes bacterium]|nr:DUF58 domain-containing protein [Armatimonadota bacterium]MDW8120717.1 DUF58 domain-containing protein [Armatimonadota bacterium]